MLDIFSFLSNMMQLFAKIVNDWKPGRNEVPQIFDVEVRGFEMTQPAFQVAVKFLDGT